MGKGSNDGNGNNQGNHNGNSNRPSESPQAASKRLTREIIDEAKLIATGLTESCYNLVEKTKKLIDVEKDL